MKNKLILSFLITIFFNINIFSQEEFIYNIEGLKPEFIVVQATEYEQNDLYIKTINWVKKTFTNPNEVIKATIENEMIRIEGAKKDWLCVNSIGGSICTNALYVVEISFKKGKYKFEIISLKGISNNGNFEIDLNNGSVYLQTKLDFC
jgi:hypothetical protein